MNDVYLVTIYSTRLASVAVHYVLMPLTGNANHVQQTVQAVEPMVVIPAKTVAISTRDFAIKIVLQVRLVFKESVILILAVIK